MGKSEELEKLTGSLLVDSSKIGNLLGWKAAVDVRRGDSGGLELRWLVAQSK